MPPTLALFFSSIVTAQADYYIGDTKELPTLSPSQSDTDHAVIAVNAFGDVIVVNQAAVSGNQKLIEANVLSPNGSSTASGFTLFPVMLLGDPLLDVLGVAADTCKKPDVEVLGDNSFMVVWSRHDLHANAPVNSRVEACLVTTRDANGILYPAPVVLSLNAGEGFLIDGTANSSTAGLMPDIAAIGNNDPGKAYVVYAHETASSIRANETYREYDIRCVTIDWDNQPNPNTFISAPVTLVGLIPFDNENSAPYEGGLILPDAVIDDYGKLVVCHEEYVIASHMQHNCPKQGSVRVMRYEPDTAAIPFEVLNDIELLGNGHYRHQRRPSLAASNADADNTLLLSWAENDTAANMPRRALFRLIEFDINNNSTINTLPWNESFGEQDHLPITAMSGTTRLAAATREFPLAKYLMLSYKKGTAPRTINTVSTPIRYPHRSAHKLLDNPNATFLFTAFEGGAYQAALQYRIYFHISSLQ